MCECVYVWVLLFMDVCVGFVMCGFCNVWMCGFCYLWVCVCVGVLTVVWVFWQYVYLHLLCFVLFLLCVFILICYQCNTTATE